MLKTTILAATVSVAFAASAAAAAGGSTETGPAFRVAIPAADLDLKRPEGRAALIERSRQMAEATCAPQPFPAVYERRSLQECRHAFDSAVRAAIAAALPTREVQGTR